jgi:hypothetical protein
MVSWDQVFEGLRHTCICDAPTAAPFNHVALDVPTLDVDTTDAYSPALDVVVRFARSSG